NDRIRWQRASRTSSDSERLAGVPAAHGSPAGRTARRSRLCAGLLCLKVGSRQRCNSLSGWRGLGRAVLGLSRMESQAATSATGQSSRPEGFQTGRFVVSTITRERPRLGLRTASSWGLWPARILEGRVPFLDHKFVELAMSIPTSVKSKHGTLKYILKKSVRGLIPDELIDRKKQGFGVPIYEWSFDRLGSLARAKLEAFNRKTDLFDPAELQRLLVPSNASGGHSFQAWCLLNFVLWWEQYIDRTGSQCAADVALIGSN